MLVIFEVETFNSPSVNINDKSLSEISCLAVSV